MNDKYPLIFSDEVDSTNEVLLTEARKGAPEWTTIVAHYQTAGKGQGKNNWVSKKSENILMSVLLKPVISDISQIFLLNKAIAVAISKFSSNFIENERVFIKWPNDILIDQNKISGILIENSFTDSKIEFSIVGIGFNVNQIVFPDFSPKATSLALVCKRKFEIKKLVSALIDHISMEYNFFSIQVNHKNIEQEYHKKLFNRNKRTSFLLNNKMIELTPKEVNNFGQLVTEDKNGKIVCYDAGMLKQFEFVTK
ncbi:biotin--[acetyl-CoA-carboxylase] ligase [Candidatus Peregrinibacteria bacterium]|nr:biotin--[acetyl-CoA-carboxylase] ligase [Candidatus Peregrinibacteria bacterium]